MDKKKCDLCGYISEENIEKCPECEGNMVEFADEVVEEQVIDNAQQEADAPVAVETTEGDAETAEATVYEDGAEIPAEAPKASKAVKIICAVVAVVLVAVAAICYMNNSAKDKVFNVSSFSLEDLNGKLESDTMGMYYEFIPGEVTADVIVEVPAEETAASDAATASDAAAASDAMPETKTESRTFDGKFTNGFTDEYIDKVLAMDYISKNNLQEEYQKFVTENAIDGDGVDEYIQTKGITEEDINSMEGAQALRDEGASYTTEGYFDYDADNKVLTVYDSNGQKQDALLVKKEGLVAESGFMAGKTKKGATFDSSFVMRVEEYGATQTIVTYKDGNALIKISYDDAPDGESIAGTYEVNGNVLTIEANGQKVPYTILNDGLASYIFK